MNTARSRALATQEESIQNNIAQIEEAKARPTAIQAMAQRLNLSPAKLQETLRATVFKGANDSEFAALIVVANEYKLNPLTKEIYAFAAKGGGIVPLVSIDGWVRIMNEHPQFDGIEFEDIVDEKGKLYAIESIIWRKDRSRPIKVTEYLDECKRNTDPWNKSPNRMLRHRALIQGARYAFGFSGIYADDEVEIQIIGDPVEARNVTPPTRAQMIDQDTGEIIDTVTDDNPNAAEGRAEADHGDQHDDSEEPHAAIVAELIERAAGAGTIIDLKAVEKDWQKHMEALPDGENSRIDAAVSERREHLESK
ncbi:phage recombination protein Bet [Sphingopyxis sp. LARHCG72]